MSGDPLPREAHTDVDEFKRQMIALIPSLRSFARVLCGNRDMADDLAQEAMTRAWAARERFALGTNFRAWMFMILRNQFYSTIRKNSRISAWDPEAAERLLITPATQHVGIDLGDVEKALGRLPVEQREVLMLVAAEQMTYEEAAEVTGCALGTVKSRIARGRVALTRMINGGGEELEAEEAATAAKPESAKRRPKR
jgi:RNA polymerase sigma-70 factor (ECF subfamily)